MHPYKVLAGEPIYGDHLNDRDGSSGIALSQPIAKWTRLLNEPPPEILPVTPPREQKGPVRAEPVEKLYFASTWARTWARFFDAFILYLLFGFALVFFPYGTEKTQIALGGNGFTIPYEFIFGCFILRWFYLTLFLRFFGATPGKRLFGLRVVSCTDSPGKLSLLKILARVLMMDFGFVVLGYTWLVAAFFRRDRRHLFDIVAGTIVVQGHHRPKPKTRWIMGGLLVLYTVGTLPGHLVMFRCLRWSSTGVTFQAPMPPAPVIASAGKQSH